MGARLTCAAPRHRVPSACGVPNRARSEWHSADSGTPGRRPARSPGPRAEDDPPDCYHGVAFPQVTARLRYLSLLLDFSRSVPPVLRHVTTPDLILAAFVAGCGLLSLLAEIRPRKTSDDEDEPARESEQTSVSLAA